MTQESNDTICLHQRHLTASYLSSLMGPRNIPTVTGKQESLIAVCSLPPCGTCGRGGVLLEVTMRLDYRTLTTRPAASTSSAPTRSGE